MILEFEKKQAKKTSEENKRRKQSKKISEEDSCREKTVEGKKQKKTSSNIAKIYEYLAQHGESKTNDIADYINLSPSRTRAILSKLENVEIMESNTNRRYKLKK